MQVREKTTGSWWALAFALLGAAFGFLLAAQHLPLDGARRAGAPGAPDVRDRLPAPADIAPPQPARQEKLTERRTPVETFPVIPAPHEYPFDYNYALARHGAIASGGVRPEMLIDGKVLNYAGSGGYAYTSWKSKKRQSFIIELKEPTKLNVIRFLLYDRGQRFFRYTLEGSEESFEEDWFMLADRSQEPLECRGWQLITFKPRFISRLRLTGTYGSSSSAFYVVELEAYHVPGGLDYPWVESEF